MVFNMTNKESSIVFNMTNKESSMVFNMTNKESSMVFNMINTKFKQSTNLVIIYKEAILIHQSKTILIVNSFILLNCLLQIQDNLDIDSRWQLFAPDSGQSRYRDFQWLYVS